MPGARVVSVNRGMVTDFVTSGVPGQTAIDRRPAIGPVAVRSTTAGFEPAEGSVEAGTELAITSRPDAAVTVAGSMRAYYGDAT